MERNTHREREREREREEKGDSVEGGRGGGEHVREAEGEKQSRVAEGE